MNLQRLPDWPDRLARLIAARLTHPFMWGVHDCALWAADVVEALTGVDIAAGVRGTYSTALQAERVLRVHGGLKGLGDDTLGQPIHPLESRVGDVGLVMSGGREVCAVCNGDHWLAPAADGLAALDLFAATTAWRVGS
ncbi:DUF6950 family protein [Caldimonas brevitalea]|uniref:DUF6950 domain-containing protein n=1 Tax=Caldimonas brevitalea TaxID=413882 RepID=A0A0G3BHN3_9BURK|nr:hypothetical protein [Caldimonas brevitalea]AKJ28847.1 hypothetical protein AAW51_2156 [Caldimonas brevitalea]